MCKHAETLRTNKGCNLAIVFIPISPFSNIVINTVINAFLLVQFDVDQVKSDDDQMVGEGFDHLTNY